MTKYSLGIISQMSSILQTSKNIAMKNMIVSSLPAFIEIIGARISTITPSVVGLTSLLISHSYDVLEVIEKFVVALGDNFPAVCVQLYAMLLDTSLISDRERTKKVLYAILTFNKCKDYIIRFPNLPDYPEFRVLRKSFENFRLFDRLSALNSNLSVENLSLVTRSLETIKELILENEMDIQRSFLSELSNAKLQGLLQGLFSASVKFYSISSEISTLCTECIGILGAVDPERLRNMKIDKLNNELIALVSDTDILNFITIILQQHLVPSFRSANPSKRHALIAYTIQEFLKLLGITPETLGNRNDSHVRKIWNSFPKDITIAIEPLLESRYNINQIYFNVSTSHPIYPTCSSHKEWIREWLLILLKMVNSFPAKNVAQVLAPLVQDYDTLLSSFVLPYIFFHILITSDENSKLLLEECLSVLFHSKNQHSLQVIFELVDSLHNWKRKAKREILTIQTQRKHFLDSEKKEKEKKNAKNYFSSDQEFSDKINKIEFAIGKVVNFLNKIPDVEIAEASLKSNAYARALLHFGHKF